MAISTALLLLLFGFFTLGALVHPILGILGYAAHYTTGWDRTWYAKGIQHWGIRYSYILAIVTALGIALHWRRLRSAGKVLRSQEWLMLAFLGIVWLSLFVGVPTKGRYTVQDHPTLKFTKMFIFAMMLTHVVTTTKRINVLLWLFVVVGLVLGLQAYTMDKSAFVRGRLQGVGGPDFTESNFLASFLAAMLPLIAVQFLRSGWRGRLLCLASGAFTANAIVLTRSRGALIGLAAGAAAALLAGPKRQRFKIAAGIVAAGAALLYLSDPQFRQRATTILADEGERDWSAQSRIEIWRASFRMFRDRPLGWGAGNFYQVVGRYDQRLAGRDAHNTFVRCYTELGLQGIALLGLAILNAVRVVWGIRKRALALPPEHRRDVQFAGFGFTVSLAILLASCLTVSMPYVEGFWWFLLLPVCLTRAVDNLKGDLLRPTAALDAGAARQRDRKEPSLRVGAAARRDRERQAHGV